jgi:hypothetical protein
MATNSIYKEMRVKSKRYCRSFVAALENAKMKSSKNVVPSKRVQELRGDILKKMFGD